MKATIDSINIKELGYRNKALGIIIDDEKNFLIDQLNGYKENEWNFPGGGIEEGETPDKALLRELKEELGTDKFEILKKSEILEQYDWPPEVIARRFEKEGRTWKGQISTPFLVKFTGNKDEIKPDPEEIREIKWVKYEELKDHLIFRHQWEKFEKIIDLLLENN